MACTRTTTMSYEASFSAMACTHPQGANTRDRVLLLKVFCKLSTEPTPTEFFTNPNGDCYSL